MGQVFIFDTTLRDGTKSPGTILTIEEKTRIAKQLARLKVDVIEAGFPAASEEQFQAVERICGEVTGPTIAVLARATNPRDFEIASKAVQEASRARIHTFVPASRQYREHFLRKSAREALDLAVAAIGMAKQAAPEVEFSLVDAFRANPDEVVELVAAAVKEGATSINLADTVGIAVPADVTRLFKTLREKVPGLGGTVFSVHCHNDLGLALANSLAALEAGALQVHCTVNGIGERAGNTATEELAAALSTRAAQSDVKTSVALAQLYPTSQLVQRLTGVRLHPHKPVVGANAFVFEAGAPQLADSTEKPPYEVLLPDKLGVRTSVDTFTPGLTLEQFKERVSNLGYDLESLVLEECYKAFQELAEKKEHVFDADIEMLVGTQAALGRLRYRLLYLNVTAGSISFPNATVQIEVDGQVLQDAGFGHGPVDAAFKTIFKITRRFPRLVRYEVNAVTVGTDAQGEVTVRLQEDGHVVDGRAVDTDVVLASARALVDGLNKLENVQAQPAISEFTDEESWMPRL